LAFIVEHVPVVASRVLGARAFHGFGDHIPGITDAETAQSHEGFVQTHEASVAVGILSAMTAKSSLPDWRLAAIRTAAELKAQGKSAAQIANLTHQGTLVRVRRGVYAPSDMAAQVLNHPHGAQLLGAAAELLAVGPGAVASHDTAARVHGVDLLARPERDAAASKVTLTRRPGHNRSGRPGVRVHSAELPADHVTVMYGMPVTTVARTIIDLGRSLEFRAGVVAADSALRQRLVTTADLEKVLTECEQWSGVKRAVDVVAFADERAESVLESLARVVIRDCGLPPPELQVWVGGAEAVGRVDFLWRQFRTVAEVDGRMKYSDPSRAVRQLERDRQLRDAGYEVVHFGWQHINENPGYVNSTIRRAFNRGTHAPRPAA
jgi:predicted transcriptional regulator of viral defense system